MSTAPPSMSAPRRIRRRQPVQEVEEETSSEEETDNSAESSSEEEDDSEQEQEQEQQYQQQAPPKSSRPPPIARSSSSTTSNIANTSTKRRPPPKPLNTSRSTSAATRQNHQQQQQQRPRNLARPSTNNTTSGGGGGGGSSVPSYEDSISHGPGDNNYSHLPTPPTSGLRPPHRPGWNSPLSPPLPPPALRSSPRPRRPRTHTLPPALEHAAEDSYASSSSFATSSSSSSSSAGPWRPMAPGGPSSSLSSGKGKAPVPLKRNKTVREPATAPVQAVVPRVPRNIAAAKMHHIDEEYDDGEDDGAEDVDDILWRSGTGTGTAMGDHVAPPRKQVAGGKKASLAVELKMNLEIELELKAYIHGDVTLELFN